MYQWQQGYARVHGHPTWLALSRSVMIISISSALGRREGENGLVADEAGSRGTWHTGFWQGLCAGRTQQGSALPLSRSWAQMVGAVLASSSWLLWELEL